VSLRLLELTIPDGEAERLPDLFAEIPVIHLTVAESGDADDFVRVLVDAQHVEAVTDVLVNHYGPREDFRIVSLPVEATVPSVEPSSGSDRSQEGTEAGEGETEKKPQRISREELYEDLAEAAKLTNIYLVMVALSTVVAAVGLIRGDVAIVIGAMVIAPLLGPNIALSLACTLGDPGLARRALKAIGAGVVVAGALAFLVGMILTVDPSTRQIAARTQAGFADILLALAAGTAGTLAFTSGVPAVVVGVMVAVALLPPLATAGLLAGSGHWMLAGGALMLVLTNVTCVNLAATATFLVQRVRPRTWWETEKAKRATRIAVTTWIIMLLVLAGLMLLSQLGMA
jgi:uncharacterized hydrophobic protein (TIGR00341 family)